MSINIRTTNWKNFNKVSKKKIPDETPFQYKNRIVQRILKRYDLWHVGVVVKKIRNDNFMTHYIITEAQSLSMLANAIACNDAKRIKDAINQRINMRGIYANRKH